MRASDGNLVITGGEVLLPDGRLVVCDICVENGKISSVGKMHNMTNEIDATGYYVVPGLIDIHTHAIGRISSDEGSLEEYARMEASRGTTTFYPTLFAPPESCIKNLKRHREETDNLRKTPQVGGFRMESPYLAETGAGVSKDLSLINTELTDKILDAGGGFIKLWDVSPELNGAPGLIRELSDMGIVCSLAHTLASIEVTRESVDAGARLITHLFDMFPLPYITDPDPGVYPAGLTDYLLIEDRVVCEIIGDGTHVHPILVEITLRCKTAEKTVFVTDANYGAGLPPGRYLPPGSWGNIEIKSCNDGVRMLDRDMELAGSALTPIDSFRNAVRLFHQDLGTASRLCSKTPAELLDLNKGEIVAGRDADILVINKDFNVKYTIVSGDVVFSE